MNQRPSPRLQRMSRLPIHRQRRSSRRPSPRHRRLNRLLSLAFLCLQAHGPGKIGSDGTVLVEIAVRPEIAGSETNLNSVAKTDVSATIRNRIRLSDHGRPRLHRLHPETGVNRI
jgi:hypothetical protein